MQVRIQIKVAACCSSSDIHAPPPPAAPGEVHVGKHLVMFKTYSECCGVCLDDVPHTCVMCWCAAALQAVLSKRAPADR